MSRDGDGKPPNPFATPGPGAGNPFEDIMGTAPASAPNPFAQNAAPAPASAPQPSEPPANEPPAITLIRASKTDTPAAPPAPVGGGDAMEALGLDIEERKPPPKQKQVRPELEEWRSEMAYGAATPTAEPPNLASVSNPRIQALPPAKKGGALKYVAIAVAVVVVIAGAGIAQRVLAGSSEGEAGPAETLSEADQLLQLGIRPENAPDCFTRDKGFDFSFVESSGKTVTVASIADVPVLYRINAKCLPER